MKLIVSAAITAAALTLTFAAPAQADYYEPVCSTSPSYDPPSGTYTDKDGRKWAGFKADGSAPESLASGNGEQHCSEHNPP